MNKETNIDLTKTNYSITNTIIEIKKENQELGSYLESIFDSIIKKFGNETEVLQKYLDSMEKLLKHVQDLLKLKKTINNEIKFILNNPTKYDSEGYITLLNERRKDIKKHIQGGHKKDRIEDEITKQVIEVLELFTKLQAHIIATYVKRKLFVDEIENGTITTTLWADSFTSYAIKDEDEIERLKEYIYSLNIQNDDLNVYLALPSYNIKQSIDLWNIVAENLGIKYHQTTTRDDMELGYSIQSQSIDEGFSQKALEEGDLDKLIRSIPISERVRLEREWLSLVIGDKINEIPDEILYIPDDREIYSILTNIINITKKRTSDNLSWDSYKMSFYDSKKNLNELEIEDYSLIVTRGLKKQRLDFVSYKYFRTLLFIKQLDIMFPNLNLLLNCLNEITKKQNNLLYKIKNVFFGSFFDYAYSSGSFSICNKMLEKLNDIEQSKEIHLELDDILKKRIGYYQEQGIDISEEDIKEEIKDKESEKSLYEKTKETYSFGKAIDFLYSIKEAGLGKIEFPEEKRKKIEKILCELEGIQVLEDTIYTPTNEELFMTIEAIIEKKCSEDILAPIKFIDKDGIPSYFEGSESTWADEGFVSKNAHLKYTLNKIERKIEILHKRNKWFDNKSICLLWLLDLLFETNCLTEYINDLINNESETNSYIESYICNHAKGVYNSFKEITKLGKNYQRHKMRWEYNRRKHYSLEEKVPSNAETEGTKVENDVISSLFKNSSEVDKSNTETLEFWKDLDFDRLISLVSDKFKIEFERERLEKEGIPERVQLPDTKIFKPSNEEIIYRLLEEAVNKKNGFEYIDKNGIYKDITKDAFYRCFFNSSGKTIIFNYKSCLMFPTLTYIYEIGRLIGTMNGLEKCIEELMKGKKIHFSEIARDDYGNKKPSAYSSIFKYAEKSWERVKDKLKSPAFHDIIGKAERDRKEHYNRILGKDSKGLIRYLKVKSEDMIPVETPKPLKNKRNKPDDHEH